MSSWFLDIMFFQVLDCSILNRFGFEKIEFVRGSFQVRMVVSICTRAPLPSNVELILKTWYSYPERRESAMRLNLAIVDILSIRKNDTSRIPLSSLYFLSRWWLPLRQSSSHCRASRNRRHTPGLEVFFQPHPCLVISNSLRILCS